MNERIERIFESPAKVKLGILFGSIILIIGWLLFRVLLAAVG